jgi:hypothetical protein
VAGDVLAARARVVAEIESGRAGSAGNENVTGVARDRRLPRRRLAMAILGVVAIGLVAAAGLARVGGMAKGPDSAPNASDSAPSPAPGVSEVSATIAMDPVNSAPAGVPRKRRAPRAPHTAQVRGASDAGCRVEQFTGADGLVHFRCAP